MNIVATHVWESETDGEVKELVGQREDGKFTLLSEHQEALWDEGFDTIEDLCLYHNIDKEDLTFNQEG